MSREKARKSGAGKFFFGTFIGFLLCLALLAGIFAFVYFKVSVKWVNDTFKTDLSIGSEEMDKKTIKDFVATALSLGQNIDTYTFDDLNNDFGINLTKTLEDMVGIDFSDLNDTAIINIGDEISDVFSSITAIELNEKIMNLNDMKLILNKTNTYYLSGGKLYDDESCNENYEVDYFDYSVNGSVVTVQGKDFTADENEVEIELWYLPLTTALGDFLGSMGDKITVGELVTPAPNGFGVELPSYLHDTAEKKAKTINQLSDVVNNIYLAEFLGYDYSGSGDVTNGSGDVVVGLMSKLAKKTIADLSSSDNGIANIIETATVADIMGYYTDGSNYFTDKNKTQKVTGIMKIAAGKTVKTLDTIVDDLYLTDVFDVTDFQSGVMSWIDNPETVKVKNITSSLVDAIADKDLEDLKGAGLISENVDVTIENSNTVHDGKNLKDLTIDEVITVITDLLEALKSTNP